MGLPTNSGKAKDQGCVTTSSNCVVWQGPDLECIGVCKGDTISDIVAKLATELCTLMDMFDLEQFDLACLTIPTSETPADMGGLIQILVNRICALEGIDPVTATTSSDCPDSCIVSIAECFYYLDARGDSVTTMTLQDYVNTIGNRICDILDDILILQTDVQTLQGDMSTAKSDITNLENTKVSTTSLNYQVNSKTSASADVQFVTDALRYVENYMLGQSDASGSPTLMYQNILKAGNISDENRMWGTGLMSSIPGWTINVQTTAESIGNIHLAIDDLRQQMTYIKDNCCSTGCEDIWLNFRASTAGPILTIFTDGSTGFNGDWKECTDASTVTITDALGNSATISVSLITLIANPAGYTFDLTPTSVDETTDLTVTADTCFVNTAGGKEVTCNTVYTDTVINSAACPSVLLTVYSTSLNYQFNTTSNHTYIANVYYRGGVTPVASQIISTPGVIVINSILGLLSSTEYDFELIVVDGEGTETPCPKQQFTTLAADCQPPINAVAVLTT